MIVPRPQQDFGLGPVTGAGLPTEQSAWQGCWIGSTRRTTTPGPESRRQGRGGVWQGRDAAAEMPLVQEAPRRGTSGRDEAVIAAVGDRVLPWPLIAGARYWPEPSSLSRHGHGSCIPGYLALAFQSLRQILGHLRPEPRVRRAANGLGEAEGNFRGDARLAVDAPAQGLAADAEGLGTFGDGAAGGLKEVDLDRGVGVRGVVHGPEGGVARRCHDLLLVVVDQLDLVRPAVLEAADDAPVGAGGDGSEAGAATCEAVQTAAVQVQVRNLECEVEALEDEPDAVHVAWIDQAHLAPPEQPLRPPVGERADDGPA